MKILKIVLAILLVALLSAGIWVGGNANTQEYTITLYRPEGEHAYLVKTYANGAPCNDPFKILTFTDPHFKGAMEETSCAASLTLIENTIIQEQPDLIVICGDIVLGLRAEQGAAMLGRLFEKHNQYWGFVLGNHDGEHPEGPTRTELVEICCSFEHCINTSEPDIWGDGNCIVNIKDSNNHIIQSLILIDSGDYLKEDICADYGFAYKDGYDFIKYDQIEWYKAQMYAIAEKAGKMPPSVMFMHIPLVEYGTAYSQALQEKKIIYGMLRESICFSPYNTGMFNAIQYVGSTQAVVCGHDHINDFCVDYRGVKLIYSQGSSFGSYYMRKHILYFGFYFADKTNDRFSDGHTQLLIDKKGALTVTPLLNQDNPSLFEGLSQEQMEELNIAQTLP